MTVPSLEQRVYVLEDAVRDLRAQTNGWAEFAVSADRKSGAAGTMLTLLYQDTRAIRETLTRHDERFDALEKRSDALEKRLGTVEERLSAVDDRLATVDERLATVDERLATVDDRLATVVERLGGLGTRVGGMDSKLDVILERLAA
jgi:chromosome segregation ATPase